MSKKRKLPRTAEKDVRIQRLEMAQRDLMAELDRLWLIREAENVTEDIIEEVTS
jgi:hypothetical protein